VERFVSRLAIFEDLLKLNAVAASDVQMGTSTTAGRGFAVREAGIACCCRPVLPYGVGVNHWDAAPNRTCSRAPDEQDALTKPAMNTIVIGLVAVLAFYVVQNLPRHMVSWLGAAVCTAYRCHVSHVGFPLRRSTTPRRCARVGPTFDSAGMRILTSVLHD
jgi:hypothetical protein